MNHAEAKKYAYRIASRLMTSAEGDLENTTKHMSSADRARFERAWEEIAQQLYNRSCGNLRPHCGEPR